MNRRLLKKDHTLPDRKGMDLGVFRSFDLENFVLEKRQVVKVSRSLTLAHGAFSTSLSFGKLH